MKVIFVAFCSFLYISYAFSQIPEVRRVEVSVRDSFGLPIRNGKLLVTSVTGSAIECLPKSSGEFLCEFSSPGDFSLTASAEGFSILRRTINAEQDFPIKIELTLVPVPIAEKVIVTASRSPSIIGETPASVVLLSRDEIESSAAPAIDDTLRQVPGFSLFRRSGSRSANPTTQGVSLRGTGASGAGRSLVLFDDVSINDPFGGWVQWSRIAPVAIERVEVLRGGAASLYGNNSLSGAVNIIPRKVDESIAISAEVFGGSQSTFSGSTFFGFRFKDWGGDLTASNFHERGYIPVEMASRGFSDNFAGSRNSNLSARLERSFKDKASVFFKTAYFGEVRENGTRLQNNRTHIRQFVFGGSLNISSSDSKVSESISASNLKWTVFGSTQVFDQTFSAVSPDRNDESLVRFQRVPAQSFGFSGQFSAVFKENHTLVFGLEFKEVRGSSNETGFFNERATSQIGSGGRERTFSLFFQDYVRLNSKTILAGGLRYDGWRNFRAISSLRLLSTNAVNTTVFADRKENSVSPQASMLVNVTSKLSFHALVSKGFRSPTLNELYRGFRVGNVVTNPNEDLTAEKALNFETGASFSINDLYLRGNIFYTRISDPIANVTLSVTSNLITRRRQNIGMTATKGFEIDAEKRFKDFSVSVGYLLSDSRIRDYAANRALQGLRVPLVSRHQFTFQTRYANKNGWSFSFQGRSSSKQFDDDLNQFRLEPFFQLDAFGSKRFRKNFQLFVGIENILNSRYSIGKTPVRTVSSPIFGRIGIRWN